MDHPEEENQESEKKGKKKKGDKNSRLRSVRTETEHMYPESLIEILGNKHE